ncbi:hypothetical protein SAMN04487768_2004 [Burkholderia sp. b13]|nr:hypothetical protein SAMN04487768_2004 [Burkholderia sp. b13]
MYTDMKQIDSMIGAATAAERDAGARRKRVLTEPRTDSTADTRLEVRNAIDDAMELTTLALETALQAVTYLHVARAALAAEDEGRLLQTSRDANKGVDQ